MAEAEANSPGESPQTSLETRLAPVKTAITDFREHGNEQILAAVAYPHLRSFGAVIAWKVGVPQALRDDALQELHFYFVRELVPLYDASRPLAPFLFTYIRTFLIRFRPRAKGSASGSDSAWPAASAETLSLDDLVDTNGSDSPQATLAAETFAEEIDQNAAIRRVADVLSRARVGAAVPFALSSSLAAVSSAAKRTESPELDQMRSMIGELHFTVQEMADEMGMPVETLRAKLKGFNRITESEISKAREVVSSMSDVQRALMKELSNLKMSTIVDRWMGLLGWKNGKATRSALASILGVSERTFERYAHDESRAPNASLRQYERKLRAIAVDPEG